MGTNNMIHAITLDEAERFDRVSYRQKQKDIRDIAVQLTVDRINDIIKINYDDLINNQRYSFKMNVDLDQTEINNVVAAFKENGFDLFMSAPQQTISIRLI